MNFCPYSYPKHILLALLATLLLSACTTNVTVNGDYPTALVNKQPLKVGLVLNESFRGYRFESEESQREPVVMALGESQVKLFDRVVTDMFQSTSTLSVMPAENGQFDLIIVPEVEEVQLAIPTETQLNVYEVWLKYNLKIYDGKGQAITAWKMSSYGKTQTRLLKSSESALNQATVSALRDAGARMITSFQRVPEVRQWYAERETGTQLSQRGSQ